MAGEVEKAEALKAKVEASIAKAREAQEKLIDLKRKVAKAQAKIELTKKRAKQLQQTARKLRATKVSAAMVKGGIAALVASQIGTVRAIIVLQVQKKVTEILKQFTTGCPNQRELAKIIRIRNTLLKQITSFRTRVQKLANIAKAILITVTTIKIIIKIITSIPLPTAIIPPQVGGIGIPVSVLTKYSEGLIKLYKLLDKLTDEAVAITAIISSIAAPLQVLEDKLRSIDISIQECSLEEARQGADLSNIAFTGPLNNPPTVVQQSEEAVDTLIDTFFDENIDKYVGVEGALPIDDIIAEVTAQAVEQVSAEVTQAGADLGEIGVSQTETDQLGIGALQLGQGNINASEVNANVAAGDIAQIGFSTGQQEVIADRAPITEKVYYGGYEISIVSDPEAPKIAPKNYAIAKNSQGVIVLRGPSSFSSSTQILIDELRFRIDQLQ
jgi:hypothetical protein